jgi:hypothetical protein
MKISKLLTVFWGFRVICHGFMACSCLLFMLIGPNLQGQSLTKSRQTKAQVGDPGWGFDAKRFDPRFPDMPEWAKAGVRGGIPLRAILPLRKRVAPGADLQAAIAAVVDLGGGVLHLAAGKYPLHAPLKIPTGVVLRGEGPTQSVIEVYLKAPFFKNQPHMQPLTAIRVDSAARVGFEDLGIRYAAADFEPYDKNDFHAPWDRRVFHEAEDRDTNLFVHLLIFSNCRDSWVDNCHFLWAGAHPLGASRCEHLTFRNNFIDRAYVKRDSYHGGYYGCWSSRYCLFFKEKVRRIRHFALMNEGCAYNVVYACDFEVDVNFHSRDDGHNLVEACRIATPVWHSWGAIARGTPQKHGPPGPGNLLYRNEVISKGQPGYLRHLGAPVETAVYEVDAAFSPDFIHQLPHEPRFGTLFALRRR